MRHRIEINAIEVHGLTRRYGPVLAVDHVSFAVAFPFFFFVAFLAVARWLHRRRGWAG